MEEEQEEQEEEQEQEPVAFRIDGAYQEEMRPRFAVQVFGHGRDLTATPDVLEDYDP
jgi:hypothetical protein